MPSEHGGEWWPETRQPTFLVYGSGSANTEGPLVSLLNLHLDTLSSDFPRCVLVTPTFLLEVRNHWSALSSLQPACALDSMSVLGEESPLSTLYEERAGKGGILWCLLEILISRRLVTQARKVFFLTAASLLGKNLLVSR